MNYVLQINSSVELSRSNFPNEELYNYLHELLDPDGNYETDEMRSAMLRVPVSIICYSRKAVGESADKLLCIDYYCESNDSVFVPSSRGKSPSVKSYDISLLRRILKIPIKDNRSSRNVMATYETDAHINHSIQKVIIENYEKKISNLALLYFGSNLPDYDLEEFEPYLGRNESICIGTLHNANGHFLRECLSQKHRNIFADKKNDYDLLNDKVLALKNDTDPCPQDLIDELKEIVDRWYIRYPRNKFSLPRKTAPENDQKNRNTYPPHSEISSFYKHKSNRYPLPDLSPKTIEDLKKVLETMVPFFYDFNVFISLPGTEEYGLKGPFGKLVEIMFDEYNRPLFKNFKLDEWYRYVSEGRELEDNIEKLDGLLIDPTETYQGPKLMMPAGWNKIVSNFPSVLNSIYYKLSNDKLNFISARQRYYWPFMVCFFKLAAMKSKYNQPITRIQAAGFIAYCTITCNGSSDIAEIIRRLSEHYGITIAEEDPCPGRDVFALLQDHENDDPEVGHGNLYSSLFEFSDTRMPKAAGSCRQPRHTLSSMGLPFVKRSDYNTENCNVSKLLKLLDDCAESFGSRKIHDAAFVQKKIHGVLQPNLEKLEGIGPFNVHHVIHLSALLGLLPLKALTFASLSPPQKGNVTNTKKSSKSDNRGPVKLIRKTCFEIVDGQKTESEIPINIVQQIFEHIYSEIGSILESRYFQKDSLENICCELNRIIEHFLKQKSKRRNKKVRYIYMSFHSNRTITI